MMAFWQTQVPTSAWPRWTSPSFCDPPLQLHRPWSLPPMIMVDTHLLFIQIKNLIWAFQFQGTMSSFPNDPASCPESSSASKQRGKKMDTGLSVCSFQIAMVRQVWLVLTRRWQRNSGDKITEVLKSTGPCSQPIESVLSVFMLV